MTDYTITVSALGRDLHTSRVASLEEAALSIESLKAKYEHAVFTISSCAPSSEKDSAPRTPKAR